MIPTTSAKNQHRSTHNVTTIVTVGKTEVTSAIGGLMSLYVYHELNKVPTAVLHFSDGLVEKGSFPKSDGDHFMPGEAIEIQMGYSQKDLKTIFKGIITKQHVKALQGRPYFLEIECKDVSVKTTLTCKSKYYYNQSDDAVIKEILKDYEGIGQAEMESISYKHEELVQYYCSDWDFMVKRADANGMYILPFAGKINLQKPTVKREADLEVQFGQGNSGIPVIEFEASLDVRDHYPSVAGTTWDNSKQELVEEGTGSASRSNPISAAGSTAANAVGSVLSAVGGNAQKYFPDVLYKEKKQTVNLFHGGDLPTEELKAWVEAKQTRGELSQVKGRARIRGIEIFPGQTLGLLGGGSRFNGTHFISGVVHQLVNNSWQTDIQFGWCPAFFADTLEDVAKDASGLVGGIRGLHIGTVTKIEGDSQSGSNRVQVSLPLVAQNDNATQGKGIWARLASLNARDGKGMIFRPEKGDEVIVGFINNDPNDAVVLGSLYSAKNKSPQTFAPKDTDAIKGFIANKGMQIIFDEEKQLLLLQAGEDNAPKIELDGKSGTIKIVLDNSNSIELTSSGVTVKGQRIDLN